MATYSETEQRRMDAVDMTEGRRGLVTMVSITLVEYHALKDEIVRLQEHVKNLDHDFAATLRHCDKYHVERGNQ